MQFHGIVVSARKSLMTMLISDADPNAKDDDGINVDVVKEKEIFYPLFFLSRILKSSHKE